MKITLKPSDSLFNAGLIGFYNILKFNKENVQLTENELIFDSSSLENFSDKYFAYISYRYAKFLSVNKLIGYRETLNEDIIKIEEVKIVNVEMKENIYQNIPTYIPEKYNIIKGTKYRLPKDYIIVENIIKKKKVKFRKFNFISCYYANNFYTDTFVDEDNYNLFLV